MASTIELRNIKTAQFQNRETPCFTATVDLDGKAAFRARNDGNGGANVYEPIAAGPRRAIVDAVTTANALAARLLGRTVAPNDPEGALEILSFLALDAARLQRSMRRATVFIDGSDLMSVRGVGKPVQDWIFRKHPDARIMNGLSQLEVACALDRLQHPHRER